MIKIYDCNNTKLEKILDRGQEAEINLEVEKAVMQVIKNVRENGDKAVLDYTEKFDKVKLSSLKVSEKEIEDAYKSLDKDFIKTLEMSADNIRSFHEKQVRNDFIVNEKDGVVLGQKFIPVEKAGIYVPGGTASYPSSVLMNAIPAQIAGVGEIIMTTPPLEDGTIAAPILAAAKVAGVTSIFKTGGAQAIAALAYGTKSIPKVDKIVGPGNIYVATAKRMVYGLVDIDMIAGPSEILVIADETASPAFIAADLLSQAEHDRLAASILVCTSKKLAKAVMNELERQIPLLSRSEIARESIDRFGKIIIVNTLMECVNVSNSIAPEHLELAVDEPFALLNAIKHAGSIFLGKNVPEALGDYFAGPNHTLPTSGTARFSSPLSVDDFIKKSSFIYYTKEALEEVKDRIIDFANKEQLTAHAKSVAIRFDEN